MIVGPPPIVWWQHGMLVTSFRGESDEQLEHRMLPYTCNTLSVLIPMPYDTAPVPVHRCGRHVLI
jgi:hypothetical protein